MSSIEPCTLPAHALLARYRESGYTDCFVTGVARPVRLGEFIEAFYTSRLFRVERAILARFFDCSPSDTEVAALASGSADRFAAWTVEDRVDDQILLCDLRGRTRSWLMIAPTGPASTRLFFGSAIVPAPPARAGSRPFFAALVGFHRLYSRALLGAARRRLGGEPAAPR